MNNKIQDALALLGLAVDISFTIAGEGLNNYCVQNDGVLRVYNGESKLWVHSERYTLSELIVGKIDFNPLPWAPKHGDAFWFFTDIDCTKTLWASFDDHDIKHLYFRKIGNTFLTKKDCEASREIMLKRLVDEFKYILTE